MKHIAGATHLPEVTILTPTHRPAFLARCAAYVARQTYPKDRLQWVIVDTGEALSLDTVSPFPVSPDGVKMCLLQGHGPLGLLRNVGAQHASGDLIVHFDDDDWHAPDRIERQVVPFLVRPSLDLVATDDYYVGLFDERPVRAMKSPSWGHETYSSGGTFMYRKRAWRQNPFANVSAGEDYIFANGFRKKNAQSVVGMRDPDLLVVVQHGGNVTALAPEVRQTATVDQAVWLRSLMGEADYQATETLVKTVRKKAFEHES
jgi:glycosyltransferase involved in cell wall biosynthesis